jgi:hypothetical protein
MEMNAIYFILILISVGLYIYECLTHMCMYTYTHTYVNKVLRYEGSH